MTSEVIGNDAIVCRLGESLRHIWSTGTPDDR
jgi:hypothetical protein